MSIKNIQQSTEQSAKVVGGRALEISEGNLVLLWDQSKGHSNIQYLNEGQEFMVIENHPDPNIYFSKPVDSKGLFHLVYQSKLQDLGCANKEEVSSERDDCVHWP